MIRLAQRLGWFLLLPLAVYIGLFLALSFPLCLRFSDAYYCDQTDGPVMLWNVWWIQHAITHLHSPWYTNYLHYPHGTTLLLHTLVPLKGLMAMGLSWVLSSVQVYNTLVVSSFALSGLSAFWLAYQVTRSYWPSIAAGYAFAFCAYRFAHASGQLQAISTEWMPVFLMAWLAMLDRPGALKAAAAALSLLLVLLCDHYQFVMCLMAGMIALVSRVWRWRGLGPWKSAQGVRALLAGLLVSALSLFPLVGATLVLTWTRQVWGQHIPSWYSADLLGLLIPGWVWHYGALTEPVWRNVGYYNETSVSIGVAVLLLAGYALITRRRAAEDVGLWVAIALACSVLALGPTLHVAAAPITDYTPYRLAEWLVPPLRLGGCPARLMIMAQLGFAVLAGVGLKALFQKLSASHAGRRRCLLAAICLITAMLLEAQPRVLSTFPPQVPGWVLALRDAPGSGAVLDALRWGDSIGMYYQTIHQRPMAWGETSRTVADVELATRRLLGDGSIDAAALARAGFRYVAIGAAASPLPLPLLFEDRQARIYQLDPTDPSLADLKLVVPPPARLAPLSFHGFMPPELQQLAPASSQPTTRPSDNQP